jgi:uncharacterized protein (TIGR02246 family)
MLAARLPRRRAALLAALVAPLLAALPLACARPRLTTADADAVRREIDAMFARSAAAWNRGDLDAFVSDYEPDAHTTYVGRSGFLHGVDAIRRAYAPRFAPGGVRDSLSFERLEVDASARDLAWAGAYYVLSRGDSVVARGPTTLVLRRAGGRWRIIHDHSS